MIKCERFEVEEGGRYDVEARGGSEVVMAELTSLCRIVRANFMPFVPIEAFVMIIADAIKKFEPDEIKNKTTSEEADNVQDFTGREH